MKAGRSAMNISHTGTDIHTEAQQTVTQAKLSLHELRRTEAPRLVKQAREILNTGRKRISRDNDYAAKGNAAMFDQGELESIYELACKVPNDTLEADEASQLIKESKHFARIALLTQAAASLEQQFLLKGMDVFVLTNYCRGSSKQCDWDALPTIYMVSPIWNRVTLAQYTANQGKMNALFSAGFARAVFQSEHVDRKSFYYWDYREQPPGEPPGFAEWVAKMEARCRSLPE
jgi:hypothetical protein